MIQRIKDWQRRRQAKKLVFGSADFMLIQAANRLGRDLLKGEQEHLESTYGRWLCADEQRLYSLIDNPVRTVNLFLSEWT